LYSHIEKKILKRIKKGSIHPPPPPLELGPNTYFNKNNGQLVLILVKIKGNKCWALFYVMIDFGNPSNIVWSV